MKKKCLIVCDDDSDILDVTTLILKNKGYDVIPVKNCEKYLEKIEEYKPDLLLLDIWMPEETGDKIAKVVKAERRFSHIPIVLFSANDNIEEVANECGADGIVKKPFNVDHIVKVINAVIDRNPSFN